MAATPPDVPAGLAPLTVGRPSPDVVVAAAADAGFAQVGLTLWPPDGPLTTLTADAAARRALAAGISASGVAVLDVGVVVLEPSLDLAAVARLAGLAAELGGDRLVVLNRHRLPERAVEQFAAVCAVAGAAGLAAAVEFMPYTATRTLGEAHQLVAAAGAPNAGVVLDVLHLYRSGGTAADLAGAALDRILLVQLCDAPAAAPPPDRLRDEALRHRRYPGDGELPLADVLAALPAGVPLTVEAPVAEDAGRPPVERARAAAAALRRLFRESGQSRPVTRRSSPSASSGPASAAHATYSSGRINARRTP